MLYAYFAQFKDLLVVTLHLSRDALHVHIGLMIFLAGVALLRGDRRVLNSFVLLLVLCLAGEMSDVFEALHRGSSPRWLGGVKDMVNTMLWPGVCVVAGPRVLRMLTRRVGSAAGPIGRPGADAPA